MVNQLFKAYKSAFSNLQPTIWILSISMFINRSGNMVLLFTSLYLTRDLHFSFRTAGLIMSCYGIGSVFGSFTGGWLTDRRGHFSIMFWSLIVSGSILFLLIPAKDPIHIGAIIFSYAFFSDMFRPANSSAIASYSSVENRTRSFSMVRLATNLGFSLGPAAGGFIAMIFGYHWLFVLDGLTSFAAAFLLYLYLPRQSKEEKQKINSRIRTKGSSAYRDMAYLVFIFLVALYGTSFFQLFASVPQYFSKVCQYSEGTIGILLALNGFIVVVVEMPLIAFLEGRNQTFRYIIYGVICLPVAFFILQFGEGLLIWSIFYTLMITLSEVFAMPFMLNYALSRPAKERQGEYAALYAIAYGISNIGAPILGLYIADQFGFHAMFNFFIVLSIGIAIGFWLLGKNKNAHYRH